MTSAQALSNSIAWQQWDGRIVNAAFPLVHYLGGSAHSAVYLTTSDGAKAAIKLIPADAPYTSAQTESWKLAQQLSHPHLVRVLDTGLWHADEEQDMRFAIMEYCEESLARVIRERTLTSDEARNMLGPCLDALKYLHGRGIVHGQIKPAHILASGDQLKLSSDTVHRNGELHPSAAVSPYDAPERTGGTISLSGDMWSLGVTIFEALSGHLPPAEGSSKVAAKLSPPFEEIVAGCLTRDRERRLSVSAVRGLLDRPAKNAAEIKSVTQPAVKPNTSTLEKPVTSTTRTAPTSKPVPPPVVKSDSTTHAWSRPTFLVMAVIVFLVLAIGIGLRLTRSKAKTEVSVPVTAQKTKASARPVAAAVGSDVNGNAAIKTVPGSVLHQVMPDIKSSARNTINGTVKVRIKVAVGTDGKVSHATLSTRGPSTYFAKQSLEAARRWSFAAPIRDGVPQASEWTLRFEFRRGGTQVKVQPMPGA
jgi:eukaryotic-like serine/threonine-protein kinase